MSGGHLGNGDHLMCCCWFQRRVLIISDSTYNKVHVHPISCFYHDVNKSPICGGHIGHCGHVNVIPTGSHIGCESFMILQILKYMVIVLSTNVHASVMI